MAIFILVAGSWHGAWCWERVAPLLETAAHTVLTPELVGTGQDQGRAAIASLAVWADQIVALADAQSEPVVLVGHSRGGIVISEAAERRPELFKRLVYLSAFLVPSGKTLIDVVQASPERRASDHLVSGDDGTWSVLPEYVGPIFYNTTEPAWRDRAKAHLAPEPTGATVTPLSLTARRFGSVSRAFIECLQDGAIPLALQRSMQVAQPCDPVQILDCDHSPFYSDPNGLAACLKALA